MEGMEVGRVEMNKRGLAEVEQYDAEAEVGGLGVGGGGGCCHWKPQGS